MDNCLTAKRGMVVRCKNFRLFAQHMWKFHSIRIVHTCKLIMKKKDEIEEIRRQLAQEDVEMDKKSLQARMAELETSAMKKLMTDIEKDEDRARYTEVSLRMIARYKAIQDEKDRLAAENAKAVHDMWMKNKLKKQFEYVVKNMETSVWLKMAIDHINVLKAQAIAEGIPWLEVVNSASADDVEVDDDIFIDGDSEVDEDHDEWCYTWEDGTPCTREEFDTHTAKSEILTNGKIYSINEEGMMVLKNV